MSIAQLQTTAIIDETITCTVSGLGTAGEIIWKNQDGTLILSLGIQFAIDTENSLTSGQQKSALTMKTAKLSSMTVGQNSTFSCVFTSGEEQTSPKGSKSFTVEKLSFGKYNIIVCPLPNKVLVLCNDALGFYTNPFILAGIISRSDLNSAVDFCRNFY